MADDTLETLGPCGRPACGRLVHLEVEVRHMELRMAKLEATFDEFRRGLEVRLDALSDNMEQLRQTIAGRLTIANSAALASILLSVLLVIDKLRQH